MQSPCFCCAFSCGMMVSSALLHLEKTTIYEPFYYQQKVPSL